MNDTRGHCFRSRQPTLPSISNRTLHHPSFLPLYVAAGCQHQHTDCSCQPVHPIIPAEFFYSDPTVSRGRRIPNIVSELRVLDCFQLNTPSPVMSACPAPPACPDPFRSGPHPTRDLGRLTLETNTPLHSPVQPSRVILQLTQEEDQAITNLLKLHHQEPVQTHCERMDSTSAEEVYKPFCGDVQYLREAGSRGQLHLGRCWSDTELEAANTLLSRFSLMEEDKIWGQIHNKSTATLSDPLPHQRQGCETLPADCTQNDVIFSCVEESGEPGRRGFVFVKGRNDDDHLPVHDEYLSSSLPSMLPSLSSDSKAKSSSNVSGGFSEVKERTLSDSEGNAVHGLLSLGDVGALDILQ